MSRSHVAMWEAVTRGDVQSRRSRPMSGCFGLQGKVRFLEPREHFVDNFNELFERVREADGVVDVDLNALEAFEYALSQFTPRRRRTFQSERHPMEDHESDWRVKRRKSLRSLSQTDL